MNTLKLIQHLITLPVLTINKFFITVAFLLLTFVNDVVYVLNECLGCEIDTEDLVKRRQEIYIMMATF